jgi:hypothetical protein
MGTGGITLPFLTSALDGGEWSASRPGRLTPGKQSQYILIIIIIHKLFSVPRGYVGIIH